MTVRISSYRKIGDKEYVINLSEEIDTLSAFELRLRKK